MPKNNCACISLSINARKCLKPICNVSVPTLVFLFEDGRCGHISLSNRSAHFCDSTRLVLEQNSLAVSTIFKASSAKYCGTSRWTLETRKAKFSNLPKKEKIAQQDSVRNGRMISHRLISLSGLSHG